MEDADFIATLAAGHAEVGKFARAIELEQKAIEAATGAQTQAFRRRLDLLKAHKAYRDPEKH